MRNLPLSFVCLALSAACIAQQPNWVQVKPKNSPPARFGQGTAYDLIRGRTVLFGGVTGTRTPLNDTWQYDGTNWTQMKPKTVPPARFHHSMVFDLARVHTLLFGGQGAAGLLNDTWMWNGGAWTQMKPKNSPSARVWFALAYDSARRRAVLFGGSTTGRNLADTWEWDGSNWTQIKTPNSPSARCCHGMAYDSTRKRIVLFGGGNGTTVFNDTWEYDGKSWNQMKPSTQPSPRSSFALAYHSARQQTVLLGGQTGLSEETWEYDGRNWTKMNPRTHPRGRWGHELMVYDSRRTRMVLFGGVAVGVGVFTDTWEYIPSQFLTASPSTISIATGGTQWFWVDADAPNANRLYWIFGSLSGTSPGVTLASATGTVKIPLNPDYWTDITIEFANRLFLANTRSSLDTAGRAQAWINVPKITNSSAIGVKFHHAYLVYDAKNNFYMASNPVELTLVK